MTGYWDIHNHILPGVDDGSGCMRETMEMLEEEYRQGVRHIVFTPHYRRGMFAIPREEIQTVYARVCEMAADRFPEMEFYLGCEYYIHSDAYTKVKEALLNNDRVLFIGLPCQVYALKQVIPSKYHENLFTIDLICHGTPSQLLLKKYCEEYNLKEVNDIKFRAKKKSKVNDIYRPITPFGVADSFLISFVKSINYYECCYECKFAGIRRCSDLTLGDSWGSELSNEEIEKGISLLLVQSQKGEELIGAADLYLEDVNIEKAIKYNAQLRAPEEMPVIRDIFFENISAGRKYDWAVFKCYPLLMIKQSIKKCLLRMKLYHFNGDAKYKILINRKDQMSD